MFHLPSTVHLNRIWHRQTDRRLRRKHISNLRQAGIPRVIEPLEDRTLLAGINFSFDYAIDEVYTETGYRLELGGNVHVDAEIEYEKQMDGSFLGTGSYTVNGSGPLSGFDTFSGNVINFTGSWSTAGSQSGTITSTQYGVIDFAVMHSGTWNSSGGGFNDDGTFSASVTGSIDLLTNTPNATADVMVRGDVKGRTSVNISSPASLTGITTDPADIALVEYSITSMEMTDAGDVEVALAVTSGNRCHDEVDASLYWASGPSLDNKLELIETQTVSLDAESFTYSDALLASPPEEATYLIVVIDENNDHLKANTEPIFASLPLFDEPTIEFIVSPSAEKGVEYQVFIEITNNAPVDLDFEILSVSNREIDIPETWMSMITPEPLFVQSIAAGQTSLPIPIYTVTQTWQWIDPQNPLTSVTNDLNAIGGAIISARLDSIAALGGAAKTIAQRFSAVFAAINVAQLALAPDYTAEVSYTALVIDTNATAPSAIETENVTVSVPDRFLAAYAGYAAASITAGSLLSTAIGAAATGVGLPFAATAAVLSAVGYAEAALFYEQAVDPPDSNFTELAEVQPVVLPPHIAALPDGLAKEFTRTALEYQNLKRAEATSRDRALGAALENEATWEHAQTKAAAEFSARSVILAHRLLAYQSLSQDFIATGDEILAELQQNGLPTELTDALSDAGWSNEDIAALLENVLQISPETLEDSDRILAQRIATVSTAAATLEEFDIAHDLAVNELGEEVLPLTAMQMEQLDAARTAINTAFEGEAPTTMLWRQIEDFIDDVFDLLDQTSNFPALEPYLDFAYSAIVRLQEFEITPDGIILVLEQLETDELISNETATALLGPLDIAAEALLDGDVEAGVMSLQSFIDDVNDLNSSDIGAESAARLTGYANYLLSFLLPGEPEPVTLAELDEQLGFVSEATQFFNNRGVNEKWLRAANRDWYFLLPDGSLRKWEGGSGATGTLIAEFDTDVYDDPSLLYDAYQPELSDELRMQLIALDEEHGFVVNKSGFFLNASGLQEKWLQDKNADWWILIPDGTLQKWEGGQSFTTVAMLTSDVYNDPSLLYEAFQQPIVTDPAVIDEQLGFNGEAIDSFNFFGENEKWLQAEDGQWYYLLPAGTLVKWNSQMRTSLSGTVVAELGTTVYEDPALLYDAFIPGPPLADALLDAVFAELGFALN